MTGQQEAGSGGRPWLRVAGACALAMVIGLGQAQAGAITSAHEGGQGRDKESGEFGGGALSDRENDARAQASAVASTESSAAAPADVDATVDGTLESEQPIPSTAQTSTSATTGEAIEGEQPAAPAAQAPVTETASAAPVETEQPAAPAAQAPVTETASATPVEAEQPAVPDVQTPDTTTARAAAVEGPVDAVGTQGWTRTRTFERNGFIVSVTKSKSVAVDEEGNRAVSRAVARARAPDDVEAVENGAGSITAKTSVDVTGDAAGTAEAGGAIGIRDNEVEVSTWGRTSAEVF